MIATLEPRNGKIDKIWVFMGIQNVFIFIRRGDKVRTFQLFLTSCFRPSSFRLNSIPIIVWLNISESIFPELPTI